MISFKYLFASFHRFVILQYPLYTYNFLKDFALDLIESTRLLFLLIKIEDASVLISLSEDELLNRTKIASPKDYSEEEKKMERA